MIAGDTSKFVLPEIFHQVVRENITPEQYDRIMSEANRRSLVKMNPSGSVVYSDRGRSLT